MRAFLPSLRRLAILPFVLLAAVRPAAGQQAPAAPVYTQAPASRDGIGKVYMGREIAQVIDHDGASWLDRPSRETEERTDKLVTLLGHLLKYDDVVADIGAGSGFFALKLASWVPKGVVIAEDIDPELLGIIERKKKDAHVDNLVTRPGTTTDPHLHPGSTDLVLLVDTYHEWDHPAEMMQAILRGLKPGGKVVQVEYRGEDSTLQILPHHKMTVAQARKEMEAAGLRWVETIDDLPQQHVIIYKKPKR